jgi:lysine biosynthesis protein LysW
MPIALCLDCGGKIYLKYKIAEGQLVECPRCGIRLKVISLVPLELGWAYLEPAEGEEDFHWEIKAQR